VTRKARGVSIAALRLAVAVTVAMAAAVAAAVTATPAGAGGPITRTEPGHLAPIPPGRDLPLLPPVVPYPPPPQLVFLRTGEDWWKAGKIEKDLSRACAARDFRELLPMRYRAVFKTDILGVAFGHGVNLYDPDKRGKRKLIYLFRHGDSTDCTVVSMTNRDARVLDDGSGAVSGTSPTAP
jgi:hypothetical protein